MTVAIVFLVVHTFARELYVIDQSLKVVGSILQVPTELTRANNIVENNQNQLFFNVPTTLSCILQHSLSTLKFAQSWRVLLTFGQDVCFFVDCHYALREESCIFGCSYIGNLCWNWIKSWVFGWSFWGEGWSHLIFLLILE